MEAFDVFVHASEREPFGIVVVEAMAMGKPVIATVPGGPQEILRDGVEGLLVPWSDGEAMSRAILRFLDEPLFALACGAEAQKRAQDFSAQRYAERVGEAVRQLLGSSRDGRNS
jgi:glycosyltransferase involved in cell wall biosynthesis